MTIRPRPAAWLLLTATLSSVSHAQDRSPVPWPSPCLCTPTPRALSFSRAPDETVSYLNVAGGLTTTILLPSEVDPARTTLQAGDGRFEPLMIAGRSVVILPRHDLAFDEHFPLLITLLDGTGVPLSVSAARSMLGHRYYPQVNVFLNASDPTAVRGMLDQTRDEVQALRAENERLREEGTSSEHALAGLLARGDVALTPFAARRKRLSKVRDLEIMITTFIPKSRGVDTPPDKVAVTFSVTNKSPHGPWALEEVRLTAAASGQPCPFAMRAFPSVIPPGGSGTIAIVADVDALGIGTAPIVIELFRDGGLRQLHVELATEDGPSLAILGRPQLP